MYSYPKVRSRVWGRARRCGSKGDGEGEEECEVE